jgi:ribosomal protein L13
MKTIKIISITLAILLLCGWCSHYEHHYTRNVTVVDTDCITVTVKDNNGHYWTFKGYNYNAGDNVMLQMYDNNTPNNIYDDIIKGVK